MAQGTDQVARLLTFHEQCLQREEPLEPTPMYTPDQKAYECCWHNGTPFSAPTGIHVHLIHQLSIPGRLSVYKVVREGWELKPINSAVLCGAGTEPFLQALGKAYHRLATLAPTLIIGDMTTTATPADRGRQATPQDHAVGITIDMLGLVDLTAGLAGQPSTFPHKTKVAPWRMVICYGDPTTIIRAGALYGPLPLGPTGHGPLHLRLTISNLTPSPRRLRNKACCPRCKCPNCPTGKPRPSTTGP